jgi:hypothetical protein
MRDTLGYMLGPTAARRDRFELVANQLNFIAGELLDCVVCLLHSYEGGGRPLAWRASRYQLLTATTGVAIHLVRLGGNVKVD